MYLGSTVRSAGTSCRPHDKPLAHRVRRVKAAAALARGRAASALTRLERWAIWPPQQHSCSFDHLIGVRRQWRKCQSHALAVVRASVPEAKESPPRSSDRGQDGIMRIEAIEH